MLSIIVAMAENNVIGLNNQLPWRIPEDLKNFKEKTMGKSLIMGRNTYESILGYLKKPLPGRTSVVVTRNTTYDVGDFSSDQVQVAHSLDEAISLCDELNVQKGLSETMVLGGEQIYREALPKVDKIYLTKVYAEFTGDAFFPEIHPTQWRRMSNFDCEQQEPTPLKYSFIELSRR